VFSVVTPTFSRSTRRRVQHTASIAEESLKRIERRRESSVSPGNAKPRRADPLHGDNRTKSMVLRGTRKRACIKSCCHPRKSAATFAGSFLFGANARDERETHLAKPIIVATRATSSPDSPGNNTRDNNSARRAALRNPVRLLGTS